MTLFKILFYGFLFYLLYKAIFKFILPVYRTTKQVKRGFDEMQNRMNQQHQAHEANSEPEQAPVGKKPGNGKVGEYIDFEEIK